MEPTPYGLLGLLGYAIAILLLVEVAPVAGTVLVVVALLVVILILLGVRGFP